MNNVQNTLFALASTAEIQDSLYPDIVCKGDELVIDYGEAIEESNFIDSLNEQQKSCFNNLESFLNKSSGEEYIDMYCDTQSLYKDLRWESIRKLATELIESMGWKYQPPTKNGATYVSSTKTTKNT